MAGWILVTLWMSANSNAVQPTTFNHVRSAESRVRGLIAEGYARSATFEALVDTVEELSCVVYIGTVVSLSQGMRGALLHWPVVGSREMPVLRVLLVASLSRDEAIAVIGHELQHVVEAVRGVRAEGGDATITAVFDKLAPTARARGSARYETEAAVYVTTKVRRELHRARRWPASDTGLLDRQPQPAGTTRVGTASHRFARCAGSP
jgi:hypothetical protein